MSVFTGLVSMKVNTDLGLALSGASLWFLIPQSRPQGAASGRLIILIVALIGAAALSEYVFRLNSGIDQILVPGTKGTFGTSFPERMAPATAMAFLAIGLALLLLDWKTRRGHRPAQILSLWVGLTTLINISGHVYHATAPFRIFEYTQASADAAVALAFLSVAILFARPRVGIAGDLTGEGPGSSMARRFLPVVLSFPIVLGWVRLQGQLAGWYPMELGTAVSASVSVAVFAVMVWFNARKLNGEYSQRSEAEIEIRKLNADLERRVAERTKTLEEQASVLTEQAASAPSRPRRYPCNRHAFSDSVLEPRCRGDVWLASQTGRGKDQL